VLSGTRRARRGNDSMCLPQCFHESECFFACMHDMDHRLAFVHRMHYRFIYRSFPSPLFKFLARALSLSQFYDQREESDDGRSPGSRGHSGPPRLQRRCQSICAASRRCPRFKKDWRTDQTAQGCPKLICRHFCGPASAQPIVFANFMTGESQSLVISYCARNGMFLVDVLTSGHSNCRGFGAGRGRNLIASALQKDLDTEAPSFVPGGAAVPDPTQFADAV
jgi:hypothetical protein